MAPLILSFEAETVVMLQPPAPAGFTEKKSFRKPLDRSLRVHRAVLGAVPVYPCSTGNWSPMLQIINYFESLRAETK
jgi:hypothetical protein